METLTMNLEELRRQIDTIDDSILSLLENRARVALKIAEAKREAGVVGFHDPERERELLGRLLSRGGGAFPSEAIRAVFREIMSGCLSLEEPLRVAFLGPEGTFSHIATHRLFGSSAHYRQATTIEGVFDDVSRGDATYGVVPIESAVEGSVDSTLDALMRNELKIRQEIVLEISHCLLSHAPSLAKIERVYSHPQALAQCRAWLATHLGFAETIPVTSTAKAAHEALSDPASAAVASLWAAKIHDLPVLCEKIQDQSHNVTRFVVIAQEDAPATGDDKTSLVFSTRDEIGALRQVLSVFEEASINLSRIESRPSGNEVWEYNFFVDIEGHREEAHLAKALLEVGRRSEMLKLLGSYPHCRDRSEGARD